MNNNDKLKVHFLESSLLNPTNPIVVNVIGAGGTGSKMMTALLEINHSLVELGHAGLFVRLWDDKKVSQANLGRQGFASSEVGLFKSVAIINRINRWAGTNWESQSKYFDESSAENLINAHIYISCVDTVNARFSIANTINFCKKSRFQYSHIRPFYWLDFGNSISSGQVFLATIGEVKQPNSDKYEVVKSMPFVTEEYGDLLRQSENNDNTPSCTLVEALSKQDLFVNSSLVQMGASLLWELFKNGMIEYRGFFHNLKTFTTRAVSV